MCFQSQRHPEFEYEDVERRESLLVRLIAYGEQHGVRMVPIFTHPEHYTFVAEKFPELDVVIDHMADCNPKDEVGIGQLLDLARFPRVYVKISHTWGISEEPYPWKDTHDLVQRVFENLEDLGPEHQIMKPNLITGQTAFGEVTKPGSQVKMSKTPQSWDDPILHVPGSCKAEWLTQ